LPSSRSLLSAASDWTPGRPQGRPGRAKIHTDIHTDIHTLFHTLFHTSKELDVADPADFAQAEQEIQEQINFQQQRAKAKRHGAALQRLSGFCLNCDSKITVGRYCDTDCQKDHEQRLRARAYR